MTAAPVRPQCDEDRKAVLVFGEAEMDENLFRDEPEAKESENQDVNENESESKDFICGDCAGEARKARMPADPGRPTQKEVDEHNLSHWPFRSWCPHCVKGKAVSTPHHRADHREERLHVTGVPTVSLDYCWADGEDDEDDEKRDHSPILIIYIDLIDALYAVATKKKGVIPWVVVFVTKKLETLGYGGTKITLKSDGENSIKALVEAIAVARKAETAIIQSPKRESRCNGAVEKAVRTWRGQLITMKCHLEAEAKMELQHTEPLVEWLVMWAAESVNYFKVQESGRTSYELATAHRFPAVTAIFAEKVMFMITPKKTGKNKWKEDWHEGVFLGVQGRTAEIILGNKDGIFRARSIRRLPRDARWSEEAIKAVRIGVAQYVSGQDQDPREVVVVRPSGPPPDVPEIRDVLPRRVKFNKDDYVAHGYTGGCPGCMRAASGGSRLPHSEDCRKRMEDCLRSTPEGKRRIEASEARRQQHAEASKPADEDISEDKVEKTENEVKENEMDADEPEAAMEEDGKERDADEQNEADKHDSDMEEGQYEPTEPGDVLPDEMLAREPVRPSDIRVEIPRSPAQKRAHDGTLKFLGSVSVLSVGVVEDQTDIMELFSPERVGKMGAKYNLVQGSAFDITHGWDLGNPKAQREMEKIFEKEKPMLLIGSPPCTRFSILMNLLMGRDLTKERRQKFHDELEVAIEHIRFCVKLYKKQIKAGRYFLHEHPLTASSWELQEIQHLMDTLDVFTGTAHMCALGLTTESKSNPSQRVPVMKPTRFMSNSWCIIQALSRRCECKEPHGDLLDGRAKAAAVYPDKLCHTICRALAEQLRHDRERTVGTREMTENDIVDLFREVKPGAISNIREHYAGIPEHWRDIYHEEDGTARAKEASIKGPEQLKEELNTLYETDLGIRAWDDPNKVELNAEEVMKARGIEMDFFKKRGVYRKVLRIEAIKKGAKIIKLKWIDTNKGDTENPNYRSRLVGMEFSSGADPENFAATPPLEALRVVVSHAGTVKNGKARKFMINDVARAYFNAKIDRDLYVELPAEDRDDKDDMVGKLELCLYGIQDAARCWQEMLTEHLLSIGFVRGVGHPCVFFHADWDVKAAVHGDDYASAGPKEGILKLKKALEDKLDIRNTHILGHEPGDEVEGKVLNRVVRAGKHGWELEADPRHAELLIKQFDMEGTKGVVSPGSDQGEAESEEEDNDAITSKKNLKEFRSAAARTNYLAQDRPDIAFAAKEVCRDMACPTMRSWKKLKRIVRYLVRRPRVVNFYDFQDHVEELTVFADANWAGCKTTRKSTSGGCVLRGGHLLRFWSKTQATIAQSSGESELLGAVRGGVEALGAMTLLKDFGERCTAKLVLDASAALGILQRRGVGKIRHLDVGALWLQEKEAQRRLKIEKVKGEKNPADLGTKHLGEEVLTRHMHAMNLDFAEGRASTATKLLSVVERSRRPGLPRDWKGSAQEDGWTLNASSEWQKTFKNARALRARDPSGPEWRRVTRYTASDEKTGETFLALDVHDVREDDRRLHTILSRPCDLKVVLEVLPEERCESYAAEPDGSNSSGPPVLSEGGSEDIHPSSSDSGNVGDDRQEDQCKKDGQKASRVRWADTEDSDEPLGELRALSVYQHQLEPSVSGANFGSSDFALIVEKTINPHACYPSCMVAELVDLESQ